MDLLNDISPDCLWWERTYGPSSVISGAVNALRDGAVGIILTVDKNIAYRHELRQAIYNNICALMPDIRFTDVDCGDMIEKGERLESGLLGKLVDDEPILKRGQSELDYAEKGGLLKNKLVYIKGIDGDAANRQAGALFNELCKNHARLGAYVIIETPFVAADRLAKNAAAINATEHIGETDMETFALLYYRSVHKDTEKENHLLNRYVEFLISCVCGKDAELAVALIENLDFINGNVIRALKNISENGGIHSLRGSEAGSGRAHPLFLLKNGREIEIERLVWKAQLQTFFPVVEEKRSGFIDKYRTVLEKILLIETVYDINSQKRITDVADLDIGQLFYCMKTDRNLFDPNDFNEVTFLRDVRNDIAHLDLLTADKIARLIQTAE